MADKLDLKRSQKQYYSAPADRFEQVEVPPMAYLQIDGIGSPESDTYARDVEALYAVSYPVKFASKALGRDYVVCPLEGLWWSDRYEAFTERVKDEWRWTMMIRQPDWIDSALVDGIRARAAAKAPASAEVRLATLDEGLSVQILHRGSFEDETPVVARLHVSTSPRTTLSRRAITTRSTSPTREPRSRRSCAP